MTSAAPTTDGTEPISDSTDPYVCDVVVVGAGPAGATAATILARAGRSVLVLDKAQFPRDKCCGDGLTTLALRELDDLGLDPAAVPNWCAVEAAWLRSPSGREVRVPLPSGQGMFAATTPRAELDAALVELAREAGADVRDGHALAALVNRHHHVDIDAAGLGPVRARYVVAADGMWSPTRKLLGLAEPGYLGEWHAFRQYARGVTGPASERLYVWFEPDLLPGYAWSFPLPGGRVNIGFGIQRDGERRVQDMAALWTDLLQRPHIAAALGPDVELEGRHTAWPIPAAIDHAALTHGRTLFVGDAARATDTMTGEGIGQAVLTGRLAAEAIIAAGRKRARPIVLTTIAMVAGMFPSALALGDGGEFRAPMAIAVIGGLVVSTLLSLVFVPAAFSSIDDLERLLGRTLRRVAGLNRPEPPSATA